ncbi:HLA class II histocompatibility antigen, DRB1 beta chain-like isoform X4 [Ovis aries]|uniref:HLA class II histocompatibility antigen, DRB1 beta chain-like isoform X4 n=1 Tax=Ovis aries TaxID=9940 RepID=UPI0029527CF4|nr:HLA class II histocompatibility antigen, DRB1 beta chain-like isoform X4 [Ovis aries]
MVCLWYPPGSWTVILPVILMVLSPLLAWAGNTRTLFMVQGKSECHFSNGTQQVRFLDRYIYNREEQVRFDSLVGEYRARTEMGRPAAERWNRWPDALQRARAAVHDFCASNYEFFASLTVQRRVVMTAPGEGNGTPLQYSCLENPMDGGAWKAAVHGVAEGRTRLSDFAFTFHFQALEKEMATHSSVLAWRIPGTGEPRVLPSMGSHRVGHD